MKIGIEGQRLQRVNKHGMDMVALELIRNLQHLDKVNQYVVFLKPDEDAAVLQETANVKIQNVEGGSYPYWEQIALPKAVEAEGCDILHCTSNTAPLRIKTPLIITLHDIIYMEKKVPAIMKGSGTYYQKFGNIYRRIVVPRVIRKSKRIITVSEFEKNQIGTFFGILGDPRLVSVYNGVGEHFQPVTNSWERDRIKDKYRLPEEFFFFLGNTDPKKNTQRVIRAFSDFLKETGRKTYLVMVDYPRQELENMVDEMGEPELLNRIVLSGYVKNTDLPGIYSLAKGFLYPSLRESFGIPVLEAMASGAPVITSNTSSMPEIAGEAALFVDPTRTKEITDAMIKLIKDPNLREGFREAGFLQAAKFSWRTMAKNVLDIYTQVYREINLP